MVEYLDVHLTDLLLKCNYSCYHHCGRYPYWITIDNMRTMTSVMINMVAMTNKSVTNAAWFTMCKAGILLMVPLVENVTIGNIGRSVALKDTNYRQVLHQGHRL